MMLAWLSDFISLIYPHLCGSCSKTLYKHENCLCNYCKVALPRTGFHLEKENPIAKIFWGRVEVYSAAAFCYFRKGDQVQHIMHQLKYKGNKKIGIEMGLLYGLELAQSPLFNTVDVIIPVPLHPKRQRQRGYNQAEQIAIGLAETMNCKVDITTLIRKKSTETQTKKSHYERFENVESIFTLTDEASLIDKHVLIVDDVITTGSTIESCVLELSSTKGIKISVAALAAA